MEWLGSLIGIWRFYRCLECKATIVVTGEEETDPRQDHEEWHEKQHQRLQNLWAAMA